jgi:hypothetical protein
MTKQQTEPVSTVGMIVGLVALIALVLVLSTVIKFATPAASGMTNTAIITTVITSTSTDFEEWGEAVETGVMQTYLALIKTITPSPPPTGQPPTRTPAPFRIGIFEISYGPFGDPHAYPMSNVWKEIVNGERTLVYVGGYGDMYAATPVVVQGIVVVQVFSSDLTNRTLVEYRAPVTTGILRIVAAIGYRLTLAGQNDETLYFDVLTRQFVDGLNVTVTAPTITSLPPITPTAVSPTFAWSTEYPAPGTYPPQIYPPPSTPTPIP